jgi:hypothetical protein
MCCNENWTYNVDNYMQSIVALAPLHGKIFDTNSNVVFNYLWSFITDDPKENWFDDNIWGGDGRILMITLCEWYGNVAPMVPEVVTAVADVVQVGGDDHHLHVMLPEVVGSNPDEPEMINLLLHHIMYGLYGPQDKRVEGT